MGAALNPQPGGQMGAALNPKAGVLSHTGDKNQLIAGEPAAWCGGKGDAPLSPNRFLVVSYPLSDPVSFRRRPCPSQLSSP